MTTLPTLTDRDIRRRVGDAPFKRGQGYARKGAVRDLRLQGRTLRARCDGSVSEPYDVVVTFDARGVASAACSCPIGDGGYCKHVAALLLTWLDRPDAVAKVPPLAEMLAGRSRDDLVALIHRMVERYPDLETLAALAPDASKPLDRAVVERMVRRAFDGDLYEWGSLRRVARVLDEVVALAAPYVDAGSWPSVVLVAEVLLDAIQARYEQLNDEEGHLGMVVDAAVKLLDCCLAQTAEPGTAPSDAALRERVAVRLAEVQLWDIRLGGYGMGHGAEEALAAHATPAERAAASRPVQAALDRLGPATPRPAGRFDARHYDHSGWEREMLGGLLLTLQPDGLDDEAYLALCRASGRTPDLVERLLALGRAAEALAAAHTASDYVLLDLLPLLVSDELPSHDLPDLVDQAEALALDRISRPDADRRLVAWAKDRARTRGDAVLAERLALQLFQAAPSVAHYAEVLDLAATLGHRDAVRSTLLGQMREDRRYNVLIRAYLREGAFDEALAVLNLPDKHWAHQLVWTRGVSRHPLRLEVARALREARPIEAEELYLDAALALIERRGRDNYAEAARLLGEARTLSRHPNGSGDWPRVIAELRDGYRRLPALLDELEKAGL
ncbi:MAG: SWIM zinc finger family protein [Bacteroidota bacterium]